MLSTGDKVRIPRSSYVWTFTKVVGRLGVVERETEGPGGTRAVISHHIHLDAIRKVEGEKQCPR